MPSFASNLPCITFHPGQEQRKAVIVLDICSRLLHTPSCAPTKKELHRDFIAAVFDMGLKKADPSRLKELLPRKERSLDAEVMKSHIQKLRSFRYQMKSTLAGDNLDTAEELAQKGILVNGELSLSLEHHRNGSMSLARFDCFPSAQNARSAFGRSLTDLCLRVDRFDFRIRSGSFCLETNLG